MSFGVSLVVPHAGARALVSDWLCEARLDLPRSVTLALDVAPIDPPTRDRRSVFGQGAVSIRDTRSADGLELHWRDGDCELGYAMLPTSSTIARVTVSDAGLARASELRRSFLLNVFILLFRRVGLHHVHTATVRDPFGRGWMLAGPSGSGKSTTAALLARHGWDVGTDDIAFLTTSARDTETEVVSWRERLALRDDVVAAAGWSEGTALGARRKTGWFPEELDATWVSRVTPLVLAFLNATSDGRTTAKPLGARETLSALMRCSPWVTLDPTLADEHLHLMARLATQVKACAVTVGPDLFDQPDLLLELVP